MGLMDGVSPNNESQGGVQGCSGWKLPSAPFKWEGVGFWPTIEAPVGCLAGSKQGSISEKGCSDVPAYRATEGRCVVTTEWGNSLIVLHGKAPRSAPNTEDAYTWSSAAADKITEGKSCCRYQPCR